MLIVFVVRPRPPRGRFWAAVAVGVVAVLAGLIQPGTAGAHTELEATAPAAGETVGVPVTEIILDWTDTVSPIDGGFEVRDPSGQVRAPSDVVSPAADVHVLQFDPPLAGGDVGVRWAVAAADGHIIEGSFSFTVDAPAPTTTAATTTTPTTTTPTTTTPPTTIPATVPASVATPTTAATPTTVADATPPTVADATPTTTTVAAAPISLDDFLGQETARSGDLRWRRVAQVVGALALVIGVGFLTFVAFVVRGQREVDVSLLRAVALAGIVASAAAVLEAAGHAGAVTGRGLGVVTDLGAMFDASGDSYTTALLMRLFGGGALTVGAIAGTWRATRGAAAVALLGAAALVVSYSFDGHTVSKGNRVLQTIADVVHVSAASIWAGGVVALAWLAWRRWRRPVPERLADDRFLATALRWSGIAGWALFAVAMAGVAMALSIVDGWGDFTGTGWGKVLLFKVALTLVAAACGTYNHFALLPALDRRPSDPNVRERVVDALAAEGFALLVVAGLAGLLIGATV